MSVPSRGRGARWLAVFGEPGIGGSVDLVNGLSKVGESVLRMIEVEGRLGLRRGVQTGLQVAEQLIGLLPGRHDELPQGDAGHQHEHVARVPVVAAATKTARERRPDGTGPAVPVQAPATPSVEATSAEIRAWAREHDLAVGDRGVISKRIIEAYALAHAS